TSARRAVGICKKSPQALTSRLRASHGSHRWIRASLRSGHADRRPRLCCRVLERVPSDEEVVGAVSAVGRALPLSQYFARRTWLRSSRSEAQERGGLTTSVEATWSGFPALGHSRWLESACSQSSFRWNLSPSEISNLDFESAGSVLVHFAASCE